MRRLLSNAALIAVLGSTVAAQAQTVPGKSQAKELFEEGVALEKKGDYVGAAARFDEAAKILPTPGVRYHQGYAYEMRGLTATALDYYESALALAREQKKPDVEKATTARMEPLRAKVPQLGIRLVTRVDAKVRLDDKEVAQPLLDGKAFRVDPGEHNVTASAPGYRDFAKKIAARESTTSTVDVVLEKAGPTAAAAPPTTPTPAQTTPAPSSAPPSSAPAATDVEPPKEEPRSRSIVVPLAVTGAAVVFAATGVVTFLLAGSAQSDAQQTCPTKVSCDDERSKVRTLDTVALVGFIGGAALGATAIVLWTSSGGGRSTGAGPSTRVLASPSGVRVEGAFW